MDMDKHMYKFICAFIGFCSMIIPGPIVPIICTIVAISMFVMKIKAAKESREGFDILMFDIVSIGLVLIISLIFTVYRIALVSNYTKYDDYSTTSSSEEMTVEEFAEAAILGYKLQNFSQFSSDSNNTTAIKNGLKTFLQTELGIQDIKVQSNKVICNIDLEKIIFTIKKNDIQYSIK